MNCFGCEEYVISIESTPIGVNYFFNPYAFQINIEKCVSQSGFTFNWSDDSTLYIVIGLIVGLCCCLFFCVGLWFEVRGLWFKVRGIRQD